MVPADLRSEPSHAAPNAAGGRYPIIDAVRGGALLAMASYHSLWDVGYLRLTAENYALTPTGHRAAEAIAGTFLTLVGVGLVLMNGRGIRLRPTLMRLARIGGAALLVTIGTWFAFPDSYVFFGILHCIAVSSVLGLPFLFLPVPVTALAAAAILAAPVLVHAPVLDAPVLYFLGLGAGTPRTNDYVPLFPWFGFVLTGIVVGRLALPWLARSRLGAALGAGPRCSLRGTPQPRRLSRPPAGAAGAVHRPRHPDRTEPARGGAGLPRRLRHDLHPHRRRAAALPDRGPLHLGRADPRRPFSGGWTAVQPAGAAAGAGRVPGLLRGDRGGISGAAVKEGFASPSFIHALILTCEGSVPRRRSSGYSRSSEASFEASASLRQLRGGE